MLPLLRSSLLLGLGLGMALLPSSLDAQPGKEKKKKFSPLQIQAAEQSLTKFGCGLHHDKDQKTAISGNGINAPGCRTLPVVRGGRRSCRAPASDSASKTAS